MVRVLCPATRKEIRGSLKLLCDKVGLEEIRGLKEVKAATDDHVERGRKAGQQLGMGDRR